MLFDMRPFVLTTMCRVHLSSWMTQYSQTVNAAADSTEIRQYNPIVVRYANGSTIYRLARSSFSSAGGMNRSEYVSHHYYSIYLSLAGSSIHIINAQYPQSASVDQRMRLARLELEKP
ncbi:hypothetical protein PILCRDRAFT_703118 [Piloderma croceum F 1598]|uniref:Uncharacterized protein n=1 Tax=Piloderma croceum (strain F 1598) TaxID=765440 RepID=A0A0C3F3G7_PILCF|nr:hypothetical protein PILCRDRAFT_703118 [Piloderma croceum F 1598]